MIEVLGNLSWHGAILMIQYQVPVWASMYLLARFVFLKGKAARNCFIWSLVLFAVVWIPHSVVVWIGSYLMEVERESLKGSLGVNLWAIHHTLFLLVFILIWPALSWIKRDVERIFLRRGKE